MNQKQKICTEVNISTPVLSVSQPNY